MLKANNHNDDLDVEWVQLIQEAKRLGLTKEDIILFLKKKREDRNGFINHKFT
ncbi:anti-repressor SinI family protein [Cytobacillus sp. Hz8]|uniref:anti-repressor SinI family protein n=1 Tax=Cytobacillus sp. Hz8 TaxID=3347168 RepID=UPI0035DC2707